MWMLITHYGRCSGTQCEASQEKTLPSSNHFLIAHHSWAFIATYKTNENILLAIGDVAYCRKHGWHSRMHDVRHLPNSLQSKLLHQLGCTVQHPKTAQGTEVDKGDVTT